eukprot:gene36851-48065_t
MGGGKTRLLEETRRALIQNHDNILTLGITFNSNMALKVDNHWYTDDAATRLLFAHLVNINRESGKFVDTVVFLVDEIVKIEDKYNDDNLGSILRDALLEENNVYEEELNTALDLLDPKEVVSKWWKIDESNVREPSLYNMYLEPPRTSLVMLANAGSRSNTILAKLIVNMVKEVILGIGTTDAKARGDILELFFQSWIEVRLKVAEGQTSPMSLAKFLGISKHDFSNALSRKVDKVLIDLKAPNVKSVDSQHEYIYKIFNGSDNSNIRKIDDDDFAFVYFTTHNCEVEEFDRNFTGKVFQTNLETSQRFFGPAWLLFRVALASNS